MRRGTANPVRDSQAVVLAPNRPLPQRFPVRLRYRSSNTITCVSGAPGTWAFGLNSLFDPDVTFTGHQPLLFDQIASLYNNYVVYNARIAFTVIPVGSETAPSVAVLYGSNTNTAASFTLDEAREQKGAVEVPLGGDRAPVSLSKTFSIRDLMGKSRDYVLDDTTYSAAVTAAPGDIAYAIFEIGTRDGASRTYYVEAVVDYDCSFSQVKQQSAS